MLFRSGTYDLFLARDAAGTLAQRNGLNAQAFRLYNTFTDSSNFERGKVAWESNVLRIGTEKAGTGTARSFELQCDGVTRMTLATNGVSLAAATASATSLNIPAGTAPTSPNNGDIWFDGTALRIRIAGVTRAFTVT